MSRPLNVVATSSLLLMMSRLLNDVATLISLQADVATASDAVLMSRPLPTKLGGVIHDSKSGGSRIIRFK